MQIVSGPIGREVVHYEAPPSGAIAGEMRVFLAWFAESSPLGTATSAAGADGIARAAIALQLLAPQIPLIFMGEEHGSQTPFLYFTSHADPELAAAVREGRRKEFASFPEFGGSDPNIPDPNSEATYAASNPWLKARGADSGEWLAW